MPRAALVLALLVTLPSFAAASDPVPSPGSVWTVFTSVQAVVRDNFATVKVIADIANRGPDPEFPFMVRVPDDAFVTGLIIERDGTVYEAAIKGRAEAREEYEAWKAKEQTGGLVEKTRRTEVYSYLINVAEFTNVRATLIYERYLAADRGVYNLSLEAPVSGFGRDLGARFDVTVRDADGVVALWGEPAGRGNATGRERSISYEVGPRAHKEPTAFTASYMLAATPDAGSLLVTIQDGAGYFAHRIRAQESARELPLDLVLVLDVSGSMAGLKMKQMIDAAKQVVATLHEGDRLHIVAFASDASAPWEGLLDMTPANRKRAAEEIGALFDSGGTNIEAGLRRGFDGLAKMDSAREEGRFPALVLLTDGQPTAGVTSRPELRDLAQRLNAGDIPIFGIAFGEDADWTLIQDLARENEGAAIRVPQGVGAEVDLRRFLTMLTTPVLRDVNVTYGPGVRALHTSAPILFGGTELLVVGTFDPAIGISGVVTGRAEDGARRDSIEGGAPASLPFLPRLVAYHEVRALQDAATPDVARIVELATRHGFVTDHTSLVLTLPPADVRPFDPERSARTADTPDASAPAGTGDARWSTSSYYNFDQDASELRTTPTGQAATTPDAYTPAAPPTAPPASGPAPEASVPGAGLALLVAALGALALARRRA